MSLLTTFQTHSVHHLVGEAAFRVTGDDGEKKERG